jgi:hypothetical protein
MLLGKTQGNTNKGEKGMKKLTVLFFAASMMLSIVFIGDALSSNGNLSVGAQTVTVRKKRRRSIAHRTYRGGKWVAHKTYRGGRMVVRKTTRGSKRVYRVTRHGGVRVYRKVKRAVT